MKYEFFWYDNGEHNDQLSLERAEEEMILFNSDISALYAMASSEDAKTRYIAAWKTVALSREFHNLSEIYPQFEQMEAWNSVYAAIKNILTKLANDEEPIIRAEAARCVKHLAKEIVVALASDSTQDVRWSVAEQFREEFRNYAHFGHSCGLISIAEVDIICDWLIKTSGGIIVEDVDTI